MSARASICVNEGMYWNSICTTSGTPFSALRAVRSLVYSSAPWPALTYLTVMLSWVSLKSSTSSFILGTQDQKVMVAGPSDEEPQPVAKNTRRKVAVTAVVGTENCIQPANLRRFIQAIPFPSRNSTGVPDVRPPGASPRPAFLYLLAPNSVVCGAQQTQTQPLRSPCQSYIKFDFVVKSRSPHQLPT